MAKTSGLGATIIIADAGGTPRTISNDFTDFTLAMPVALQDTTGVDKYAHEKLPLLRDLTMQFKGVCNFAANMSHAVLSTVTTGAGAVERATSVYPTSNNSTPVLAANLLFSNYDVARGNGGELTFSSNGSLADGAIPTWA
jgi:hypothetical protein